MALFKTRFGLLRQKIIDEYNQLDIQLETAINNDILSSDSILDYSEYYYIRSRIYICFKDFSGYMQQLDDKVTDFLLKQKNASDYLAVIYENGLAGDCDLKSVEGIEKLMIYAYNNNQFRTGSFEFAPIEVKL